MAITAARFQSKSTISNY